MVKELIPPPFLYRPAEGVASPFVFAVPHSGRHYPPDFVKRSILNMNALRQSEDAFVDELFEGVPACSAALLIATHARAYLDLNRAENELDPDLFIPPLDKSALDVSYRVQAGLGVVPQYVAENTPIYKERLPAREAEKRLMLVHRPYHQKLSALLEECRQEFGVAFLIDCHSMPSEPLTNPKASTVPTIILGDCWGSACMRDLTDITETLFMKAGFNVRRNVPYSGGYSTSSYGAPSSGVHALQIEISRALYMDEQTLTPLPEFHALKEAIGHISQDIVTKVMERLANHNPISQAAE